MIGKCVVLATRGLRYEEGITGQSVSQSITCRKYTGIMVLLLSTLAAASALPLLPELLLDGADGGIGVEAISRSPNSETRSTVRNML